MTNMGIRILVILLLTAGFSFFSGKYVGKKAMVSVETSMSDLLKSIDLVDEINQINAQPKVKMPGPKRLEDPQI